MDTAVGVFLERIGMSRAQRLVAQGRVRLVAHLDGLFGSGSRRWPGVTLARSAWVQALAACLREGQPTFDELDALRLDELYLAAACAEGDVGALEHFERSFMSAMPRTIARLAGSPSARDEVLQRLRERLFVRVGTRAAKIADFRGQGPLLAWLRVAALREALSFRRELRAEPDDGVGALDGDERTSIDGRAPDPELALLRARYGAQLRVVLASVIENLAPDDRAILRLHYVDGLEMHDVGRIYGVHRSTISRRLAAIRESVAKATRRGIREQMRLSSSEADSMLRMHDSALEVPLQEVLASR